APYHTDGSRSHGRNTGGPSEKVALRLDCRRRPGKRGAMVRRGGEADTSGEGTSWLVLRHTQAEGLGVLANALREYGIHHRYLDLPRGEPPPRDLRGIGGLIVLGGPMAVYEPDKHPFLAT